MPIFEYRCPRCGHVFEHLWRGPEKREDLHCPRCGAAPVEKRVSLFGSKGGPAAAGSNCAPRGGG